VSRSTSADYRDGQLAQVMVDPLRELRLDLLTRALIMSRRRSISTAAADTWPGPRVDARFGKG
jgi:hypothetical protein